MSGASYFETLPLGTRVRRAAVAVLLSQGTLAGLNVFDSPLIPIPEGEQSCVNVFSSERRDTVAGAGGRPGFRVMFTLQLQCVFLAADQSTAILQTDILKQQALEALLGDPVWPSMTEAVETIEEKRTHGHDGQRWLMEHSIALQSGWREFYTQRGTSVLQLGGQPGTPRSVILPLQTAKNTIVAGNAPGAGGQGSVQTIFEADTTFPQS